MPFLVWYHRYSPQIGRCKVPSLSDLYSERLQVVGYWLYVAGLAAVCVSTALANEPAVRAGCVVLAGSLAVFAVNLARMLRHFFRPQLEPLVFAKPMRGKL